MDPADFVGSGAPGSAGVVDLISLQGSNGALNSQHHPLTTGISGANINPVTVANNQVTSNGLGSENGPILYSEPNRTSAIDDIRSVVIYIFIITIFFGFFLILPGIRNEKFPTFLCITTSLIVTSIILVSLFGTSWHIAEAPISAAYKAFSRDKIYADISVYIGLQSFNVTLRAHKVLNVDINYNERFYWIKPDQMQHEQHYALERGLPYPILTVVEYLSQDEAGFNWSRQYRLAGYYSYIILWLSVCLSALMFFLHCATPKYGIYTMQLIGCLMLFTNFTYSTLVPRGERKLVIPFEGHSLIFRFGWNFWLIFVGGCLSLTVGTIIVIIDCLFPNFIFTTILDADFDSHTKCSYKKKLEQQKQQLAIRHQQLANLQTKQQLSSSTMSKALQILSTTSDSETIVRRNSSRKRHSTVEISMPLNLQGTNESATHNHKDVPGAGNSRESNRQPSGGPLASGKNINLKSTDHQTRRLSVSAKSEMVSRKLDSHQVRL